MLVAKAKNDALLCFRVVLTANRVLNPVGRNGES